MNWDKLEVEQEKACQDKVDLFDFYNEKWDKLVAYAQWLDFYVLDAPWERDCRSRRSSWLLQ